MVHHLGSTIQGLLGSARPVRIERIRAGELRLDENETPAGYMERDVGLGEWSIDGKLAFKALTGLDQ